jgi:mannonate dehydratase
VLFERAGLKLYTLGNLSVHNQDAIVLGLENRDEKIEEYKRHIRNLGKAGIPYTTYAHMADSVWRTGAATVRGEAKSTAFDWEKAKQGKRHPRAVKYAWHGRLFSEDEIWKNYEYFMNAIVHVAEEAGVRIGLHPDDPPVPELGGVPRCILSNFDGYKRALEIADSPNVGVCLCVGCWLEGGKNMGKDVVEAIRYFGERQKIFKVHLRNVETPLPYFKETFLDDGYMNMYSIVKELHEVQFDGIVIADHVPLMINNPYVGTAFSIGYIKALIEVAAHNRECPF